MANIKKIKRNLALSVGLIFVLALAMFAAVVPASAEKTVLKDYVGIYPPITQYSHTTFRGDLQRTGFTASPAPNSDHLLWKVQVSNGASARTVAVAGGTVYGTDGEGTVYALNANTGQQIWKVYTGKTAGGSFVDYVDGQLYTDINSARLPTIARLNSVSGTIELTYDIPKSLINATGVPVTNQYIATPAIVKEYNGAGAFITTKTTLYLTVGDSIMALQDLGSSMKPLWNWTLPQPSNLTGYGFAGGGRAAPIYDQGRLFAATRERGEIYAFNATTGSKLWNFTMSSIAPYMGSASDGILYWGDSAGNVYALDEVTGQVKWTSNAGYPISQGPTVAYGNVYLSTYLAPIGTPDIYVFDKTNGDLKWTWELPSGYGDFKGAWQAATLADGKAFIQGQGVGGWLQVLDAYNGTLIWQKDFSSINTVASEPVVADGRLYIQELDGYLYCFGEGPTTTEISLTTANVARGTPLAVYGAVSDASPASIGVSLANVPVKLMAQKAGDSSWSDIGVAITNGEGRFSYQWTPGSEGTYWVQAQFDGNVTYGVSHATTALQVNPTSAASPFAPQTASPSIVPAPDSSNPSTIYTLIAAAVVIIAVVALVAVLFVRRKRK